MTHPPTTAPVGAQTQLNGKETSPPAGGTEGGPDQEWAALAGVTTPVTVEIEHALIDPNPHQPRKHFDETALKELAQSIQEHGLIQPIVVEPTGERFTLHDGERRWRACGLAGLTLVPAYIVPPGADPQKLLLRAIVANDQRADLTVIERARGYQKLADEHGLTDAEIGRQVGGKSRSTITNTRRLLQLPERRRQQVATGVLSERQAMALLPLYDLPPEIQQKITTDHWDGRKLQTPEKMSSDEIRASLRAALRAQGQLLRHIEPDQPFPPGNGIRSPTCTACPAYITIGKDKEARCLDRLCLAAKQTQVITAYLSQASDATGLPPIGLGESEQYSHVSDFHGSTGEQALAIAQEQNCPNLKLAYSLRQWDSGLGPDGFDRCRYTCHHSGQKCACAKQVTADQDRQQAEHKKAVQQLGDQATAHLIQIAEADPEKFLTVVTAAITSNIWQSFDEKVLTLPPEKVRQRLVRWLVGKASLNAWNSLDDNRIKLNDWLAKGDLPPLETIDPLERLAHQLERLEGWLAESTTITINAIDGNLTNLAQLAEQLEAAPDGEPKQALLLRIEVAKIELWTLRNAASDET